MKKILHRSSCRKKRVVVRLNGEDEKRPIKSSFVLSEPKVLLQNNEEEEEEAVGEEKPRMRTIKESRSGRSKAET